MTPDDVTQPAQSGQSRFSVTAAVRIELPGTDEAEASRRADLIERAISNAVAAFGVIDRKPLVNVWDSGDA